jgi:hypothetical protein
MSADRRGRGLKARDSNCITGIATRWGARLAARSDRAANRRLEPECPDPDPRRDFDECPTRQEEGQQVQPQEHSHDANNHVLETIGRLAEFPALGLNSQRGWSFWHHRRP